MDLKQLGYFVRVAELGSFTKAAAALQVAQPALSRQVRLLEVELRQSLLLRNGRGAVPTEAGQLLLEHGRGILHQVERAREELGRVRGTLAGRVAIGLPPSLARLVAVPLTRRFRQQLPQARLSITEGLSVSMQDALLNGRLDLALLYNAQPLPELELQPLFDEELMLVQAHPEAEPHAPSGATSPTLAPHPAPLPLAELAQLPLLIPTRPNALRMHVEVELAKLGLRPRIALEIDGVAAILDLVADGLGCAVLPRHAVAASGRPAAFAMRAIGPPALRIPVALASSAQRPSTLTQRTARELILQVCAQRLGPLKALAPQSVSG